MIRTTIAVVAASLIMVVVDLIWLGVFAFDFYNENLGNLRAEQTNWMAAGMFYFQYIAVVVFFGALPAKSIKDAAGRGALLGWFAYATYELTNWAVIEAWPPGLVAIDIAWGVVLTTIVTSAAHAAYNWGGWTPAQDV